MQINTSTLQAPQGYIVNPIWDKFRSESGLLLGEESYERDDQMPTHLMPVKGTVVATNIPNEARPGDRIYFTWNAITFNKCVSPIDEQNLFAINRAWYAYMQNGKLYSCNDFILLTPEYETEQKSESGLLTGNVTISAQGDVIELPTIKKLHGRVAALPKNYAGGLQMGDLLAIIGESDVDVEVEDEVFYRTRFTELLYKIHE